MNPSVFLIALCWFASLANDAVAQESPTLRKIKETGIITIGFREKSIPFSYLDRQQRPIGYSLDICHRVVDGVKNKLKLPALEVLFRPVTAANRNSFVINDIVDLECGSTTNTIERQKDVAFSVTTFVSYVSIVSKKSSGLRTVQDLRGQTVVYTAGTTTINVLMEANRTRGLDLRTIAGKDHADSFSLLETDRAAAFVMDDILLRGLVADTRNPADYVIRDSGLSVEPYAIMIRKNDPAFKKVVDDAIVDLFKSGDINQIYRKWFLTPIPSSKVPLQLQMSPILKRVIANPTDSGDLADYR